jgi:hypothetical protein
LPEPLGHAAGLERSTSFAEIFPFGAGINTSHLESARERMPPIRGTQAATDSSRSVTRLAQSASPLTRIFIPVSKGPDPDLRDFAMFREAPVEAASGTDDARVQH